jgi:hypothetical protein
LLSANNVTTNIVRQIIKYVKSFKQNYDDQLGLLTKNGYNPRFLIRERRTVESPCIRIVPKERMSR